MQKPASHSCKLRKGILGRPLVMRLKSMLQGSVCRREKACCRECANGFNILIWLVASSSVAERTRTQEVARPSQDL